MRTTDDAWQLPEELAAGEGPLVYLSLGSLGSADVELMKTLIATLADSPYRVIVSMGPQHEELELAPNMCGAEFLPQTSILPTVDLVITHGGNNTVTESLRFGKPMVLLPLFWDQYDNAQRIDETGFGSRLSTYEHAPGAAARARSTRCSPTRRWRRGSGSSRRGWQPRREPSAPRTCWRGSPGRRGGRVPPAISSEGGGWRELS